MARFARVVAAGLPHHVTQRGNARRCIFESDADRLVYLQLLDSHCRLYGLAVLGFCLMSNHVHLVVIPERSAALALALRQTHGRYAAYLNARQAASGHVWQGRFYSCPLDTQHLWAALRYTERNPVRAGLVAAPELYRWSSAALHFGRPLGIKPLHVDLDLWCASWSASSWNEFLRSADTDQDVADLRTSTHAGRPLGPADFVKSLECTLHRPLVSKKGGRPRKRDADSAQTLFVLL
jgi:putative transposase